MGAELDEAVTKAAAELYALHRQLARRTEELFALALREVTAARALAVARPALKLEMDRQPELEQALVTAKAAHAVRLREAAERAASSSDCGC
jgi:hypothetical protein